MKIAGKRTDKAWNSLKQRLQTNPSKRLWRSAFRNFYYERIKTRYLDPIASIKAHDRNLGEGFAIAALVCSLIEFLESCELGHSYRYRRRTDPPLGPFEYSQASVYFQNFLLNREPFKSRIPGALVESFYEDVRCGLLHEARTKGGWTIQTGPSNGRLVHRFQGGKIFLYRNELMKALEVYLTDYEGRLLVDANTQAAFIRKFDFLCIP